MSMYNEGDAGGDLGSHHLDPPTRAPGSKVKGVADVYEGKPGQSRGTDTTIGTGVGGTVTNEGIPSGKDAEPEDAAKTPMTKIAEGVNEAINTAFESITGTDKK